MPGIDLHIFWDEAGNADVAESIAEIEVLDRDDIRQSLWSISRCLDLRFGPEAPYRRQREDFEARTALRNRQSANFRMVDKNSQHRETST
jgi:hypothetical protein